MQNFTDQVLETLLLTALFVEEIAEKDDPYDQDTGQKQQQSPEIMRSAKPLIRKNEIVDTEKGEENDNEDKEAPAQFAAHEAGSPIRSR